MATADLILANRAYMDHAAPPGGGPPPPAGTGGLLVAVSPVIARDGSTTWIGAGRGQYDRDWTDADGREALALPGGGTLNHHRLYFDDATWDGHYAAAANGFLWPVMHLVRSPLPRLTIYFPAPETPSAEQWNAFETVNAAFADAALAGGRGESCWVHDYQLGLVPAMVRERGYRGAIGFFLHTPFPSWPIAREFLDERGREYFAAWVRGILGASLAGFQTEADAQRFREAALALGLATTAGDALLVDGRRVTVAAFPVGIDVEQTVAEAAGARMPALLGETNKKFGDFQRPLVVGLERADYTKGIPERLRAIAALYGEGVAFSYVGIASPTREGVRAYQLLGAEVTEAAAECERLAPSGALFLNTAQALAWEEVLGVLDAADVVCTSSLSDGMNLVPLQAIAVQSRRPPPERGVVLTGQDAGVATAFAGFENEGLVPLDPLDHAALTATLRRAVAGDYGHISDRLVAAIRDADAVKWGQHYLETLGSSHADE